MTPGPEPTATPRPRPEPTGTPGPDETPVPDPEPGTGPDLTASWSAQPVVACQGARCRLRGRLAISNLDTSQTAQQTRVEFYLSEDTTLDDADALLGSSPIGPIRPGREKMKRVSMFADSSAAGKYVIAVVDAVDDISETDESNNEVSSAAIP